MTAVALPELLVGIRGEKIQDQDLQHWHTMCGLEKAAQRQTDSILGKPGYSEITALIRFSSYLAMCGILIKCARSS